MKAVLDACVLFPSVVREILIGAARAGIYTPLWSERILSEWTHSVEARLGALAGVEANTVRTLLSVDWPQALIAPSEQLETTLWLPDPADTHVLATAIVGQADVIVTFNLRDFPSNLLAEHRVSAVHPDPFLLGFAHADPERVKTIVDGVLQQANQMQSPPQTRQKLLKKARLPRLAKFLS